MLLADTLHWLGTGLVLPFLLIYLDQVRDFGLRPASLIVALTGFAALVGTPVAGTLIDRFGARRTLIGSALVTAVGALALAFVQSLPQAFAVAALYGLGKAALLPAAVSLLVTVVPPEARSGMFALRYTGLNAGIGLGSALSGLLVSLERPGSFVLIFTLQALLLCVYGGMVGTLKALREPRERSGQPGPHHPALALWRDPAFVRVWALAALIFVVGLGQLSNGFAVYAVQDVGLTARVVGWALAANTFVIVVLQLPVLRWLEGHRRTSALAWLFVTWALAWSVAWLAGLWPGATPAMIALVVSAMLFGVGETLMAPSLTPLPADLAPEGLLGRYNAGFALSFAVGRVVAPLVAGFLLGGAHAWGFFAVMLVGCAAGVWLSARLQRRLPHPTNWIPTPQ